MEERGKSCGEESESNPVRMPAQGAGMSEFSFSVLGHPEPQGSMKGFVINGRAVLTSNNKKLKPWRQMVGMTALAAITECAGQHVPVALDIDFYIAKPQSAPKNRLSPSVKPDLDKLIRGILDALTGIAFHDDGQVCAINAYKHYDALERTEIKVRF